MLAPKCPTFNGRPTFANPMYLKKAQYDKPCLYKIPHDQSDPANRLIPDREEILTLEEESRSKLNKDLVKPFDYTKLNKLVYQAWVKHSRDQFRAPTAKDMEIMIKTCLMPLALKTQNDSFAFVHELKKEMHADLKYVESLKNEIDELESDKAKFSNMYDKLLQECMSNDVMCSYLHSLSDSDAHTELQCLYLHKVKECECLAQKLSKQTEFVSKEPLDFMQKDLACPTCKKCIYSANHDECILKYLSKVNSRASAHKKDAQSHKTTKRYMPVEKRCDSKKHDKQIPIGQKFSPNKSSNVYLKTTPPRFGLTWKPTGRIFTQVGLKWIPIRKSVETRYNMNDSASPLGKETHNPKTVICANSFFSAFTSMASEPISFKGFI
ncbi:hypothetical protein Tco_1044077 [Tanacetum coccineum]|uniref:Uncharacterized protein n=1 Tax=Tanacetum coccineum TaxID=301880 RepID=A0ABQ5GQW1_9ASTR